MFYSFLQEASINMDNNITIIIGENNEGHFVLTKRNILRWGINWPIIRFGDGRGILDFLDAVRQAKCLTNRKYVLLLSLSMHNVDGLEVLRVLKSDPDFRDIPAMILTTVKDTKITKECLKLGCDGILSKPLDRKTFLQALSDLGPSHTLAEIDSFE